ncbi:MAG: iron-containing alcohol dehydrogenase, partial [Bacteroidota bacterium]
MDAKKRAADLLRQFKGDAYSFGLDNLDKTGEFVASLGRSALVIANTQFLKPVADRILVSLRERGISLAGERIVPDAGPNAPREDVYRIESYILHFQPDCLVAIGGGSAIDAAKAANALAALGGYSPEIEAYFGTGLIAEALAKTGRKLRPLVAVQTAASSGAHLTKYANITDPVAGQKKLIVDE